MAKLFTKKFFFDMTLLHAHAQYIYIVNAPSVKALLKVDFPVYAQAKSLFKSKQEKNGSFILSKNICLASNFFMQMFNESILCRQSIVSAQAVVQVEFPAYALSIHMSYKIAKL